ncbi:MAG: ATP-binding protein [Nitrospirae bacterium]|nr:ATP-binding protein [Nitrospirota bacterium]MBF0534465.1 ATP-binding protein [Nitrospirota bacterium]MBF0617091.1 ATP-binding protein [Nitrospirota bacterium]
MLVTFSVANNLSFKKKVTLSMVAASVKEHADHLILTPNPKLKLLKSAVIYGANASGKSNLIKSITFMRNCVLESANEKWLETSYPFLFDTESINRNSHFEIIFMLGEVRYRYGFELLKGKVQSEWLYSSLKAKERKLFKRELGNIEPKFKEGKGLEERTRPNALFLSVCAQWNGEISTNISNWFSNVNIISGIDDRRILPYSLKKLEDETNKNSILDFIKIADLQIEDIKSEKIKVTAEQIPEDFPEELRKALLEKDASLSFTLHNKYDNERKASGHVKLPINFESEGTLKIISLSAPILEKLADGTILVIDEMDARLHPIITKELVKIFNTKNKNAQFIMATHDTNLLKKEYFRRDQIWFTEKDRYGATDLYSLVEFKVRNDASYNKDYIMGKYGAVPFIGDFSTLTKEHETANE